MKGADMMTIDEAIAHAREVAENKRKESDLLDPWDEWEDKKITECISCAEEHEQIAEWLEELKANKDTSAAVYDYESGYAKAIDEFAERLEELFKYESAWGKTEYHQRLVIDISEIYRIAEEMRGAE